MLKQTWEEIQESQKVQLKVSNAINNTPISSKIKISSQHQQDHQQKQLKRTIKKQQETISNLLKRIGKLDETDDQLQGEL